MKRADTLFGYHAVKLLEAMLAHPHGATRAKLLNVLYADDPEGGPLSAVKCLHVRVSQLRRKLKPYGIYIMTADTGPGGPCRYFVPADQHKAAKALLEGRDDRIVKRALELQGAL